MKKKFTYLFLILPCLAFSQGRLVLNNDPYIVLNGGTSASPAYIVLDNSASNAITLSTAQVNGGIKSESEFNQIKWNIGTTTGTYIIPFTKAFGGPIIPFTATINSAGAGTGNLKFSTYPGATWDNATYMPSDVTNMGSAPAAAVDNSSKVVDRFWIADANGYTTKPNATLAFTYIDAEVTAAGNSITEGNLGAQRFNSSINDWQYTTYAPQGIVNTAANTVTAVPAVAADLYRSWTLVDNTAPLPIELINMEAACDGKNVQVKWSTATETNNSFFTIEKSNDGISFLQIGTVTGAGNSSATLYYSYTDHNPYSGTAYYRLKQTDFNGTSKYFNVVTVKNCDDADNTVNAFNNQAGSIVIAVHSEIGGSYTVTLFDALGKRVRSKLYSAEKGDANFNLDIADINSGVYFVTIDNTIKVTTKKIFIGN